MVIPSRFIGEESASPAKQWIARTTLRFGKTILKKEARQLLFQATYLGAFL
jgi:hypothetical protein